MLGAIAPRLQRMIGLQMVKLPETPSTLMVPGLSQRCVRTQIILNLSQTQFWKENKSAKAIKSIQVLS